MTENSVSIEDRIKVHELCRTQLGGKWAEVSESDLVIKPAPAGFVNKLFFCFLPQNIETKDKRVVVRYVDFDELKDCVNATHVTAINLILSQYGISPRILSIFHNGTISEYIESRYFNASDDLNNKTVELLAQKVAKFHSLEIPIPKDGVKDSMELIFTKWFDSLIKKSFTNGVVREEIEKHKYPVLSKLNFIDEMEWLRKTLVETNSPIVFSHNDIHRRNILIREGKGPSGFELFLIDFDWTGYSYRGIDFGDYFSGWQQKEVDFGYIDFPSDQEMSVFINGYVKEMSKIFGPSYAEQEINSPELLIREAKIFALLSFLKDILYCSRIATVTDDKAILCKAEDRFRSYDELKTRILSEYNL